MPALSLIDISKSFGATRALNGVSFDVARGEVVALLGPSGCGKSTLLSLIAGLDEPDQGKILWEGQSMVEIPTHKRGFGLMFQDYMLFPHMNVAQNVAFGLRFVTQKADTFPQFPTDSYDGRVKELLELVGLSGFERRDVSTLSGGEQQRVALARSLAPKPRLLMLDEPLGALDRTLRERLLVELKDILRQIHQTALYVTHDQEEAFAMADRIVILRAGQVEQIGSPQEIYRQPATPFVARFLGFENLIEGEVAREDREWSVMTEVGKLLVHGDLVRVQEGKAIVLIRPDRVRMTKGQEVNQFEGKVREVSFRGNRLRATVEVKGIPLKFDFPFVEKLPDVGNAVSIALEKDAVQIFSGEELLQK